MNKLGIIGVWGSAVFYFSNIKHVAQLCVRTYVCMNMRHPLTALSLKTRRRCCTLYAHKLSTLLVTAKAYIRVGSSQVRPSKAVHGKPPGAVGRRHCLAVSLLYILPPVHHRAVQAGEADRMICMYEYWYAFCSGTSE